MSIPSSISISPTVAQGSPSFGSVAPDITIPASPTDNVFFGGGFDANNVILAGEGNKIINSRRCSVIQGFANQISGKYNTHIIGDFVNANADNTFFVGCENFVTMGAITAGGSVNFSNDMTGDANIRIAQGVGSSQSEYDLYIGPAPNSPQACNLHVEGDVVSMGVITAGGSVNFSNDMTGDANIRIAQGVGSSQSEYDLYIGPAPNSPQACNLHVEGDVVSYYASDKRLKDDITLIDEPLSKVMSLDAIEFNWNDNQSTYTGHDIGLIAQQVEEVTPEIVETRKDGYKAIKYEKVNALLVGAIQEQQKKIEFLEKRLESLERRSSRS